MVSLMTPPPSSSPSQSAYTQSTAVKRPTQQPEDEYRGPDGPLPKRRRKASRAVGELEVVSLLSDDDTKNGGDNQPRLPGNPEASSCRPEILPTSSSRSQSHSRDVGSANALSGTVISGPDADQRHGLVPSTSAQIVSSAPWPARYSQPPAQPSPVSFCGELPWVRPRPRNEPLPLPHWPRADVPNVAPTYSFPPVWNHAASNNESGTARSFDTPTIPRLPAHQNQTFAPSQGAPWPHQQWYGYNTHSLPNTHLGYTPQPSYMPPMPGTASYPITLDGPVQSVSAPVYTPPSWTASQLPPRTASNPILPNGPRQNTTYSNSPAWSQSVPQPAAAMTTEQALNVGKPLARKRTTKPAAEPPAYEPVLCPEQEDLVRLIESRKNVFYTGSAGCGKSTVLKAFVKRLQAQGKRVRIVAPTGRAALNVGGATTWTFAGWTPASHKLPIEKIVQGAHGNHVYKRITETDVLVIDEISMVENLHFERLNVLMKAARHDPKVREQPAFGGCQVVVTGDFCQLPPVKPFQHCIQCGREMAQRLGDGGKLVHVCRQHGENLNEDKWAFRSKAWQECAFEHVHLKMIHRQNDQTFIKMLQKCRLGSRLTDAEIKVLMHHRCRTAQATKLYSTRKEAKDVNRDKFDKLAGIKHAYWCHDTFFWSEKHPHLQWKNRTTEWGDESGTARPPSTKKPLQALEDHRWGKCVQLKQGMLVVLLTNLDLEAGLCNGSQGLIKGFEEYDPKMMPMRETYDARGRKKVEAKPGQRVVRGEHAAIQEAEIKNFITSESAPIKKWPVVRFHNGVVRTVYAECSIAQLGDDEPYCLLARTQIPLAPAWAMTIHKSQSLTLDRVIVNLSKAFEEGQVYVALSRATGLEGLKIEGDGEFLRSKLMVNPEVAAFLKEKFGDIYGVNDKEDVLPALE